MANLFISGARKGSCNPFELRKKEQSHAERMYKEIRHRTTDCSKIVRNIGGILSLEQVSMIKSYIFYNKHMLSSGIIPQRFFEDYEIAQSWDRLSKENKVQKIDILLLYHELTEIQYLLKYGRDISQDTAHDMANRIYNYSFEIKKLRASQGKDW